MHTMVSVVGSLMTILLQFTAEYACQRVTEINQHWVSYGQE